MKTDIKREIKSYCLIILGAMIHALAFDWFLAPNQIPMGGFSGLAQVINALVPALPVGTLNMCLNIPLFLVGWKFLGHRVLISSLVAVAVSSATIDTIAAHHTFASMDPFLASICGGAMLGFGLGLIAAQGATLGGASTLARLIKLRYAWISTGNLILISDALVLMLAAFVFGTVQAALYGTVALFLMERVMDKVLYGMDIYKVAYVISDRGDEIAHVLMEEQERGVTILRGEGAYTGTDKHILMVAFRQKDIVQIKRTVHQLDNKAFLVVQDAHMVLGSGFDSYQKGDL